MAQLIRPIRLRCDDRAEPGRRATWLELFFDLAFVAAVAQVGTPLGADYTLPGLARYTFLFLLIWWAWNGHTNFSTRFDTDDLVQRVLTFTQILVVAVMAVNAKDALDSRSSAGFAAAYAGMRFVLVGQYWRARGIRASQPLVTAYAVGFGCAAVIWLASALVSVPARFWLWGAALVIDLGTPLVTSHLTVHVPPDAEHLPERFGLFTIILLGESLVAVMKGMESQEGWSAPAASAAFLGVAVAFFVWWWYFDGVAGAAERSVRTRSEARRFMVWSYAHLPLYLSIAVTGVGIEHIIRIAPDGHLHTAEVWILCGAVSVLMLSLVTIGAMASGPQRVSGNAGRVVSRYVLAASPLILAGTHLEPVPLVTGLTLLCFVQLALSLRDRVEKPDTDEAVTLPAVY
jgi:low temperature requirement protein LtrA